VAAGYGQSLDGARGACSLSAMPLLHAKQTCIGADIGGTFPDLVWVDDATGAVQVGKLLTTPKDPSQAVEEGVVTLLDDAGDRRADVRSLIHGERRLHDTLSQTWPVEAEAPALAEDGQNERLRGNTLASLCGSLPTAARALLAPGRHGSGCGPHIGQVPSQRGKGRVIFRGIKGSRSGRGWWRAACSCCWRTAAARRRPASVCPGSQRHTPPPPWRCPPSVSS